MDEKEIEESGEGITLFQAWLIFKKKIVTIIIVTLLFTIVGVGVAALFVDRQYTAEVKLIISYERKVAGTDTITDERSALLYANSIASTLDDFLDLKIVSDKVAESENPDVIKKYGKTISVGPKTDTSPLAVIKFTTTKGGKEAIATVNCVADALIETFNTKDESGAFLFKNYAGNIKVAEHAEVYSSSKNWTLYVVGFFIAGFVLSYAYAIIRHITDDTVKSRTELEALTGYSAIAFIEDISPKTSHLSKG